MPNPSKTTSGFKALLKADLVPINFEFQNRPSQIYPLGALIPFLNIPQPLKKSDHNLLIVLKKGKITLQIDTEIHVTTAACIIFIPADNIYAFQTIGDQVEGFFVLVENKVLTAIMSSETILNLSLIHSIAKMNATESMWFCRVCSLLYEEVSRKNPNRKIGQSLLQAMLYKLLDMAGLKRVLRREQQIAVQFKQLVNEYLPDQKNIAFFAAKLSISANYLNRCLQSVFKKNAHDIITETQILRGKLMLLDTIQDIKQIAHALNFDDPSYFSRTFKKVTGFSPTAYRNANMHS